MSPRTIPAPDQVKAKCAEAYRRAAVPDDVVEAASRPGLPLRERDHASVDTVILALFAGGVSLRMMAAGLNATQSMVDVRTRAMGLDMDARRRALDLDGERWKKVPGWRLKVSNLGRVKSLHGRLLNPKPEKGNLRLRFFGADDDPKLKRMFTVASLVQHVFRGQPLDRPARHLNGDPMDCRLINLVPDRRRHRTELPTGDRPWTKLEDRALKKAASIAEAVTATGHTVRHVRARMRDLGIPEPRPSPPARARPLDRRDLDAVKEGAALMEAAGLTDIEINLALCIIWKGNSHPDRLDAVAKALKVLHHAGWRRDQIAEWFGWGGAATVGQWLIRTGLTVSRFAEGGRTAEGPGVPIPGERWKEIEQTGCFISDQGRVRGRSGQLVKTFVPKEYAGRQGRPRRCVWIYSPGVRRPACRQVALLVLAAFKPDLRRVDVHFLNGDTTDCRAENMVPRDRSRPAGDLFAQAKAACPRWMETHVRNDLINDMVVIVMDGRASGMAEAFKLAVKEYNALTGNLLSQWDQKQQGLDAPIGDGTASLMDRLTSDGEIMRSARKSVNRPD